MGVASQLAVLFLREHRFRPVGGALLSIARQTVYLTPAQALALVERETGVRPPARPEDLEIDASTRGSSGLPFITDRAFYGLFSDARYRCLDVTDYEGADIVADLSGTLPAELEGQFDFIFDGGCLDNIFDPAGAIRNLARLLRPGGRLLMIESAARVHHAYLAFSLAWFHDYFALNDFADCQVYLAQFDAAKMNSRWDLYHYEPVAERRGEVSYFGQDQYYFPFHRASVIVIAEKAANSTADKSPIQFQYRPDARYEQTPAGPELSRLTGSASATDPYFRSALRFARSPRPLLVSDAEKVALPSEFFDYAEQIRYCGSVPPARDDGA